MERGDDGDDEDNDETEVTKDDVDDDDEMITTNVNDDGKYYRRASPGWHLSQPPRNAAQRVSKCGCVKGVTLHQVEMKHD